MTYPAEHAIVLRLTGAMDLDGVWMSIKAGSKPVRYLQYGARVITLTPTGNVEWNGNACAEVWVPEDKLDVWNAEHDLDR